MKTDKYSTDCGLSKQEWELDKLADNILECKTSLGRIGILRKYIESFAKETAIEFVGSLEELEFRDDNAEWNYMPSIKELTEYFDQWKIKTK